MGVYWRSKAQAVSEEPEIVKALIEEISKEEFDDFLSKPTTVYDLKIDGDSIAQLQILKANVTLMSIMIKTQILEAIKQMPNLERLEVIEFTLRLLREDMKKPEKLNLATAAEIMRSFYEEGSELTEFVDTGDEDFCEYHDYAQRSDLALQC